MLLTKGSNNLQAQISINASSRDAVIQGLRDLASAIEHNPSVEYGAATHMIGTIGYAGTWLLKVEAKSKKRVSLAAAADAVLA